VAGAGFVVAPGVVATCAHVVSAALDTNPTDERPPPDPVNVDFPLRRDSDGSPHTSAARVSRWAPIRADGTGDVALLRLESAPLGVRLPPLRGDGEMWGHEFQSFGFPA